MGWFVLILIWLAGAVIAGYVMNSMTYKPTQSTTLGLYGLALIWPLYLCYLLFMIIMEFVSARN